MLDAGNNSSGIANLFGPAAAAAAVTGCSNMKQKDFIIKKILKVPSNEQIQPMSIIEVGGLIAESG